MGWARLGWDVPRAGCLPHADEDSRHAKWTMLGHAGKTTVALFRMFDHWRRSFEEKESLHQVFITVSATLKEQVR